MIKIETTSGKSLYSGTHRHGDPVVGETIWINFSDYRVVSVEKNYYTSHGKSLDELLIKVEAVS